MSEEERKQFEQWISTHGMDVALSTRRPGYRYKAVRDLAYIWHGAWAMATGVEQRRCLACFSAEPGQSYAAGVEKRIRRR